MQPYWDVPFVGRHLWRPFARTVFVRFLIISPHPPPPPALIRRQLKACLQSLDFLVFLSLWVDLLQPAMLIACAAACAASLHNIISYFLFRIKRQNRKLTTLVCSLGHQPVNATKSLQSRGSFACTIWTSPIFLPYWFFHLLGVAFRARLRHLNDLEGSILWDAALQEKGGENWSHIPPWSHIPINHYSGK